MRQNIKFVIVISAFACEIYLILDDIIYSCDKIKRENFFIFYNLLDDIEVAFKEKGIMMENISKINLSYLPIIKMIVVSSKFSVFAIPKCLNS